MEKHFTRNCQHWVSKIDPEAPLWYYRSLFSAFSCLTFMDCPHCSTTQVSFLKRRTNLGYSMFRCKACRRTYNQRTGTLFNFIEVPTDILFQVLLLRVRYKLSYRNVAEFFLIRGFEFSHETVRDWEERFLPHFTEQIRYNRSVKVGKVWLVDETYVRVKGA